MTEDVRNNKVSTAYRCFSHLRISQYSKLCDMIMEEKTKYVQLKEITSQTITELTEQIKVLENEMEIQRTIAINKDRCVHVSPDLSVDFHNKSLILLQQIWHSSRLQCLFLLMFVGKTRQCQLCISGYVISLLHVFSRSLTKARMKVSNSSKIRDKIRNLISKVHLHKYNIK